MCGLIAAALMIFGGLFGYVVLTPQTVSEPHIVQIEPTVEAMAVPTQVVECASASDEQDMQQMLALVGDTFKQGDWEQQVRNDSARTTATWRSAKYDAVAYLELLHYDCGVSKEQIDQYFSAAGFAVLLANYTSYEKTAQCEAHGVKLFEFDAVSRDSDYHIFYWVDQVSPTRVAAIMLTFPTIEPFQQALYAGQLFPDLPTCEPAAG